MAVQGNVKTQQDFGKSVGMFAAKVIAINPDKEGLEKIYGPQEKEPEYVKEKEVKIYEEGGTMMVPSVRIVVYLQEQKTDKKTKKVTPGKIFQVSFYLEDRVKQNKDGSKKQYINSGGTTSWAASENDLLPWFVARDYREAMVGEEELYNFAKAWLQLDFKDPGMMLDFNFANLISGDVSELTGEIGGQYDGTLVAMATIKTKEVDGEVKEFQSVYNRAFLPAYTMEKFKKTFTEEAIDAILNKKAKERKGIERFIGEVADSEYGVKDFYSFAPLHEYDASKNMAASDAVISEEDEESSDY
jgi:hypothetical protein